MRSLRRRLRDAVLAVPIASSLVTLGCEPRPATWLGRIDAASDSGWTMAAAMGPVDMCTSLGCDPSIQLCGPGGLCQPLCPLDCACEQVEIAVLDPGPGRDGGELDSALCAAQCPLPSDLPTDAGLTPEECHLAYLLDGGLATDAGSGLPVICTWLQTCSGRRPEGWIPPAHPRNGRRPIASYLASAAALEAASVPAFERLARELAALGAPVELVLRAEHARAEESAHAAVMTALAERAGAPVARPEIGCGRKRSALVLAVENAIEGCVRETFGAALALFQSQRATSVELRAAMSVIAADEAAHAELAWEVDAWLAMKLRPVERAQVEQQRQRAIRDLGASLSYGPGEDVRAWAGLPSVAESRVIFDQLWEGHRAQS